jgi:hypothetical protein
MDIANLITLVKMAVETIEKIADQIKPYPTLLVDLSKRVAKLEQLANLDKLDRMADRAIQVGEQNHAIDKNGPGPGFDANGFRLPNDD